MKIKLLVLKYLVVLIAASFTTAAVAETNFGAGVNPNVRNNAVEDYGLHPDNKVNPNGDDTGPDNSRLQPNDKTNPNPPYRGKNNDGAIPPVNSVPDYPNGVDSALERRNQGNKNFRNNSDLNNGTIGNNSDAINPN